MILGIDFGTCFSHVSIILKNGELKDDIVKSDNGSSDIPSKYLYVDGKDYYGDECEVSSIRNKHHKEITERFKMDLLNGRAKRVIRNGVAISYEDVLKKYLGYLIKRTKESLEENGLDCNIDCIAITVPSARSEYGESSAAEYSDIIKKSIHEITELDDKYIVVIQEPTAAAYSYLADDKNEFEGNQTFMIFDLGGGTADVAIVNHNSITGSSNVLADRGIQRGAHLWNSELAKILRTNMSNINISGDDTDVEKLKRDLTRSDEAWFARDKTKCKVQRSLFDQNTSDLREDLMLMVDKVMDDAKIDHFESIDKLILVGGGSNMPQIKEEFITRYQGLNKDKIVIYRPSVAISNGAALYAKEQVVYTGSPRKGKEFIRRASHSYGLEVYRDDDSKYTEVLNLIFKGEEYENGRYIGNLVLLYTLIKIMPKQY